MKVIIQQLPVYGKIFVGNRDYYLLQPEPVKWGEALWTQSGVLKFYVMNGMGFACHLLIRGDFFIDTYYAGDDMDVHFTIEDDSVSVSDTIEPEIQVD